MTNKNNCVKKRHEILAELFFFLTFAIPKYREFIKLKILKL